MLHVREKDSHPSLTAMRRVALLLDGMSRATILPFGPSVIHRLLFDHGLLDGPAWSQVALPLAITVMAYTVGRFLGTAMAEQIPVSPSKLVHSVARLGGAAFALHIFSFGAGLTTVRWLVAIRLLAGALAGFLCRITRAKLGDDYDDNNYHNNNDDNEYDEEYDEDHDSLDEEMGFKERSSRRSTIRKNGCFVDVTSGTAKIYMTGGLLYKVISESKQFQVLTGGEPFTLSPMFFVFIAFLGELCLRALFWYATRGVPMITTTTTTRATTNTTALKRQSIFRTSQDTTTDDESEFFDPLSHSRHNMMMSPPRKRTGKQQEEYSTPRVRVNSADMGDTPLRVRVNSAVSETSASEFFDCESFEMSGEMVGIEIGGPEEFPPATTTAITDAPTNGSKNQNHDPYQVAEYKDHKCVYPDGSPAFVPQGYCEATVPPHYLEFCGGNEAKAMKMWEATQTWRREKNVWRIHTAPHIHFPRIKEAYPHFLHGHSRSGFPIIYEQPGKMNLKEMFRSGCKIEDMVRHYMFFMEFVCNGICMKEELRKLRKETDKDAPGFGSMVAMDVSGVSLSALSGDVVRYLSRAGEINNNHYPLAMKRAFLVNSPFWLAGAWSGIKGIIPDSVQVDILSPGRTADGLRKFVDDDQIPKEYGGSSPYALGEHPYEKALQELVAEADKGEEFDGIVELGRDRRQTYSFDHSDQRWVAENDEVNEVATTLNAGTWRTEITRSPLTQIQPLRRRTASCDRHRGVKMSPINEASPGEAKKENSPSPSGDILAIVSAMYLCWCAVQGSIECLVPLWILTPPILGGLGYQPSRAGVALFCGTVVVLWVMRTKFARFVAKIPGKAPMRAFRVGVGSEVALFILLPLVPNHVTTVARADSVLNMASTVILLATLAIASMLGRTAASILHKIACEGYARSVSRQDVHWIESRYGPDRLVSDCRTGKLTNLVHGSGEMIGILVLAPLYAWSTVKHRPTPFDATFCFFMASFVSFAIYVSSFSLHLNVVGEFESHPARDGTFGGENDEARHRQKCWSIAGEALAVPVSDIASLLEEANWSSSPLLGYSRGDDRLTATTPSLHGPDASKASSTRSDKKI